MTTLTKRITVAEFREMDFPEDDLAYYELINGELARKSSPAPKHQIVSCNFFRKLDKSALKENWLNDAQNQSIEVYRNTPNGYEIHSAATLEGKVTSSLLIDFSIELKIALG